MSEMNEMPVTAATDTDIRVPAKAYAAMSVATDLVPWSFTRRTPRPTDVQVEILY